MGAGIAIGSSITALSSADLKYRLGRQVFGRLGAAIVGLDVERAWCAELKEWDDGYWSVVLHRQGGLPVAVGLGNMSISQWLAREQVAWSRVA